MKDSKKYKVSDEFTVCEGWKSPITVITDEIVHKLERDAENNLIHTVNQTIGYEVDKEELIKALSYDRDQYNKGYKDAIMTAHEYIKLLIDKIEHLNSRVMYFEHEDIPKEIYEFYFRRYK